MSSLNHLFDLPEQICYVQCGFCNTILLVSVPCSSMSMVVTVRCGHCNSLLSVNMMKVSFVPFHLLASLSHEDQEQSEEADPADEDMDGLNDSDMLFSDKDDDDKHIFSRVINKPPEKRQRAPSAYNCFIKEEIKRLKAENPNMPHKEAFSTAAKNWAHFPPTNNKEDGGSYSQDNDDKQEEDATWNVNEVEMNVQGKGFHERKGSIWPTTPF